MSKELAQHKIGESFANFLLIKNASKGVASNSQPFLTLTLADKSGTITAKVWSVTDDQIRDFAVGVIVYIQGTINEYRGSKQLQVQRIHIAGDTDNIRVEDLQETAPESESVLRAEIDQAIFNMKNETIRRITRTFIERYDKEFFEYPAASDIHHAFINGLAYHTVSMLRIGNSLCDLYPELNRELLSAGIILHDIGKIHEYVSASNASRTLDGTLLGHIPIMMAEIGDVAKTLNISNKSEEVLLLQHMILSHHGKPEWGSARTPLIREAEVLHHIDNIDAKLNVMNTVLSKTEPGTFTEKVFALDNRSFYKPLI